MERNRLSTAVLVIASSIAAGAKAEDIHGTVIVKQKLTRHRVTPTASLYQRGPAVELRSDRQDDPLASERVPVVVYLEGAWPSNPVTATIEQKDRRCVPELLTIPVGSTVSFPNLDPIFHNVFSLSMPKSFDLGNYPKDHTRSVTFTKPGVEFVSCHLHPNMSATIVITPNAWRTTADRAGRFTLRNVPAGPYTIVAWHKAAGFFRKTIVVEEGHNAVSDFFIPIDMDSRQEADSSHDLGHAGGSR